MLFRRALLGLLIAALPAVSSAQIFRSVNHPRNFAYYKTSSLVGASEKVTIQQPASGSRTVQMQSVTLYASVATVFTLSINGTAASSTAGAAIALSRGTASTAVATVWHTSNAGAGTTLHAYSLAADEKLTVDLSKITLEGDGTTKNISIATDSVTGDVRITFNWEER